MSIPTIPLTEYTCERCYCNVRRVYSKTNFAKAVEWAKSALQFFKMLPLCDECLEWASENWEESRRYINIKELHNGSPIIRTN